jgi:hypothetical protein
MRSLLLIPFLASCAIAPAHLEQAKANVDSWAQYAYYKGNNRPYGLPANFGNCLFFAKAYELELKEAGYVGMRFVCRLPDGQYHAATYSNGWVLDNRYRMVVPFDGYDCKPI